MPHPTHPDPTHTHPTPPGPKQPAPASLRLVALIAALILLAAAAVFWSGLLLMGFAAILIAIALRAGARGLHALTGLPMRGGVPVVLLAVLALAALGLRLAGRSVADQFGQLVQTLPQSWQAARDTLSGLPGADSLLGRIDDGLRSGEMAQRLPDMLGMVLGGLNSALGVLSSVFLMLILSVYLAMEGDLYRRGAIRLVPIRHRPRAAQILDELAGQLGRWMAGQALDMIIVALLVGVGLWLLDVPLALILAVIAGLTNIVPIIGPFLSGAVAVLVALPQGLDTALWVAAMFTVIQVLEGDVLMPMIQKYAVALPPALTLLALIAVGALFGPAAVILATPLLIVAMHLIRRIYVEDVLGDPTD